MKNRWMITLLFLAPMYVLAEKFDSEIKSLPGEKWYGAYTAKAFCNTPLQNLTFQPYEANEKRKDLHVDNRGNQAAPLLVSNKGRYVWSDEPFAFELKNGDLFLYSDYEKLQPMAAGKTLRDAYVGAKEKHFPASGKTPNPLMFQMPQYNMWIELNYNQTQEKVLAYASNVLKNGFPGGYVYDRR